MEFEDLHEWSEYGFRINLLTLENFRGFDKISVNFEQQITVLLGVNGSGKTALLDAVAKMLEIYTWQVTHVRDSSGQELERLFLQSDLQNGKKEFSCELVAELSFRHEKPKQVEEEDFDPNKNPEMDVVEEVSSSLNWLVVREKTGYKIRNFDNIERLTQFAETVDFRLRQDLPVNLPVIVYFPVQTTLSDWSVNNAPKRTFDFEIFQTYYDALNGRSFDFRTFFEWFKWQENIEKQLGTNDNLETVRQAIYQVLNDSYQEEIIFDRLHVDWRNSTSGELIIYKSAKRLLVNQFSSGEKAVVSLVSGIALRLILANPKREKPWKAVV